MILIISSVCRECASTGRTELTCPARTAASSFTPAATSRSTDGTSIRSRHRRLPPHTTWATAWAATFGARGSSRLNSIVCPRRTHPPPPFQPYPPCPCRLLAPPAITTTTTAAVAAYNPCHPTWVFQRQRRKILRRNSRCSISSSIPSFPWHQRLQRRAANSRVKLPCSSNSVVTTWSRTPLLPQPLHRYPHQWWLCRRHRRRPTSTIITTTAITPPQFPRQPQLWKRTLARCYDRFTSRNTRRSLDKKSAAAVPWQSAAVVSAVRNCHIWQCCMISCKNKQKTWTPSPIKLSDDRRLHYDPFLLLIFMKKKLQKSVTPNIYCYLYALIS